MGSLVLNHGPQAQPDARDRVICSLEEEVRDLNEQLAEARRQLDAQRSESTRAVGELRRQLQPLHLALRAIFGEIDVIVPADTQAAPYGQSNDKKSAVWESWKQKLSGKAPAFITELLIHGEMTGQQLMVATRCSTKTLYNTITALNKAQLLNKNGSKYSLKEL